MAENSPYFNAIADARAMELSTEEALAGMTTLSMETCEEIADDSGIYNFIHDHTEDFLRYLRKLPTKEQDLLFCYYFVGKTQTQLAQLFQLTQTTTSFQIRLAVRALCAIAMFGGDQPKVSQIRPILRDAGLETVTLRRTDNSEVRVSLSALISEYLEFRSFAKVAAKHNLHRPEIRRTFSRTSKEMMERPEQAAQALGSWLALLIDKVSPTGTGYSVRAAKKLGDMYLRNGDVTGKFRIRIEDGDFGEIFQPRANM